MSDAFNSSPAKVGDLLSTSSVSRERIVVPTFQRGYMWKKKHVEAFWEDVNKQRLASKTKGADPHFLGPIVTLSRPSEGIIWLLDGQQRLATATILFSVIRDAARSIAKHTGIQKVADFAANLHTQFICNEDGQYSIELGETDMQYFRETIQIDPPENRAPRQLTHRNIKTARSILSDSVFSATGVPQLGMDYLTALTVLKELKQTIVSDLITARIPVNSEGAAFKIFATLNDRGLRLSPPDLLLSYLMEKARDSERKDIRAIWTQMIQKMGTHDIHEFLRAMWISRYGDLKNQDLFTALRAHIEANQISSLDFARDCGDECDYYLQLISADEVQLPSECYSYVRALARELNFRAAVPVMLSGYSVLQPDDFGKTAAYLLVFIVRYSIIGNRESSGMENLFFRLARELRERVRSSDDKAASKQALAFVKDELAGLAPDDDSTKKAVESAILENSEAKYVLSRIARMIQDEEGQVVPGDTNLEHIYPQNPAPDGWGGQDNQEKLEPLTWHIGNITVYGKRANRKAGNAEFSEKLPRYEQSKVAMTNAIPKYYSIWDESTIKRRSKYLAKFLVRIWNFNDATKA